MRLLILFVLGALLTPALAQATGFVSDKEIQGEVEKFKKWGLDILPHRRLIKEGIDLPDAGPGVDAAVDAVADPDQPAHGELVVPDRVVEQEGTGEHAVHCHVDGGTSGVRHAPGEGAYFVVRIVAAQGFSEHRRGRPGEVFVERYW